MEEDRTQRLTALTVELLAAFVSNNSVRSEDLPTLISATHQALTGLAGASEDVGQQAQPEYQAAVSVRKSLSDRNVILSLIDGKPYKSLRRHITARGLTPESYRERYNLPATYPMVAPGYSEERRAVAKRLGLGRKPATTESAAPAAAPASGATGKPAKRPYNRRLKIGGAEKG